METIQKFFAEYPQYYGVFFCLIGIFMIISAIKNWEWVLGGHSWNLSKIEGISNFFGRKFARVVMGIFGAIIIIAGIIWFFVYTFYL